MGIETKDHEYDLLSVNRVIKIAGVFKKRNLIALGMQEGMLHSITTNMGAYFGNNFVFIP
jgi:hypothetical protein